MDSAGAKLLIIGSARSFEGLVSVGDIQRALVRGTPIEDTIDSLPEREVAVASPEDSMAHIKSEMLRIRAEFMPVVDKAGHVTRIHFWSDVFGATPPPPRRVLADVPVVVMAGGKGTRLRPLTHVIPKPLIPIGEQSILEHILDRFKKVGCSEFYLTVNYKAEMLRYYLDRETDYGQAVSFVEEHQPLGTAGSLQLLANQLDRPFFVTNCDILIDADYSEIFDYHERGGYAMTMVTSVRSHQIPYGTVELDAQGKLISLSEKPELTYAVNAGMYVLQPDLLDRIPVDKRYDITSLISELLAEGQSVGVFPVSEQSWRDIGVWPEYLRHKDGFS